MSCGGGYSASYQCYSLHYHRVTSSSARPHTPPCPAGRSWRGLHMTGSTTKRIPARVCVAQKRECRWTHQHNGRPACWCCRYLTPAGLYGNRWLEEHWCWIGISCLLVSRPLHHGSFPYWSDKYWCAETVQLDNWQWRSGYDLEHSTRCD